MKYAETVLDLVGNTPLVKLNSVTDGIQATVLVKVEYVNPGGSSKDRIAQRIIDAAEAEGKQKLSPDPNAVGAPHTTFRRGPDNSVTHYAEWTPNPRSPRGYDIVKRYDGVGGEHFDKATRTYIPTPHVQGPGWVRPPQIWEIPR